MKIALVHDWLTTLAGAEKVLEVIYKLYPSPIYTLVKNEENFKSSIFEKADIRISFIQKLPKYRNYLVFFPLAIEQFDLSEDVTTISQVRENGCKNMHEIIR
ncbi:hypothetical protein [Desulfurobacterium atlanticum]|uniref:Glycosyltransferase family 4 protein n=1 Tax=Desulfurobacterium atlanticum TaxID=240169 RepID=A0A238XS23_9BACT|nr:hypothetical protein [Desulfurobacterium atlanticum]SNR60819.1 hypothetical protein SAMN06265340_101154 [Desulfurobacterium atlanticum]